MAEIKRVAVIGAGVMGRGIAHAAAAGGYQVALHDVSEQAVVSAISAIQEIFDEGVRRGKIDAQAAEAGKRALRPAAVLEEAVVDADFVIEAVIELMEVKHATFTAIERYAPAHAILATNTSAMSVTEIAGVTREPERVIGMHFFNPVHKMKLVEIIKGLETQRPAVEATLEVSRRMGKETVEVNEYPGFATSRISAMIGNEAMYMLAEGVGSPEDIDKAVHLGLNHPMGPLELGDLVGWDTRLKVLQYMHQVMGDKFRPCPLIYQLVKSGRLGRKTGKGVYEYGGDGMRIPGSGIRRI
jgi:3-hydroxybutyryl-CoA dehydrogenase